MKGAQTKCPKTKRSKGQNVPRQNVLRHKVKIPVLQSQTFLSEAIDLKFLTARNKAFGTNNEFVLPRNRGI